MINRTGSVSGTGERITQARTYDRQRLKPQERLPWQPIHTTPQVPDLPRIRDRA